MAREIVLASGNRGKLAELTEILAELPITLRAQSEFEVSAVEETGSTFVENAIVKARHAALESGRAAIADDSGIVVPVLEGAPGIRSARYAGEDASDEDNVQKLLGALEGVGTAERGCCFVCVMVYMRHPTDPLPLVASGVWWGRVLEAPRGTQGFGYDPVFLVPEAQCTAAELAPARKNVLSHRAQASRQLLRDLSVELIPR